MTLDYKKNIDLGQLTENVKLFDQEYNEFLKDNKINEDSFVPDIYTKEKVNKDKEYVKQKKAQFKKSEDNSYEGKKAKIISETMEKIISLGGELSNWFGGNFYMLNACEYDDISNATDILGIFIDDENEDDIIGVSFDITSSSDEHLEEKIKKNVDKIAGFKNMPRVEYFENENIDYKGQLDGIVPLVIGLDSKNSENLINQLGNAKKTGKYSDTAKNNSCSIVFLKQIEMQLKAYSRVLEDEGKDPYNYLPTIVKLENKILKIIEEKREILNKSETRSILNNDGVIKSMRNYIIEKVFMNR